LPAATPARRSLDVDPLTGEPVEVLWVKGSGGDLGSIKRTGFATLYQQKLLRLSAVQGRGPRRR
jgi:rhamnose utilization protein RhaD (predicted bifunctional aldolase and dehydrogenase)